MTPRTRANLSLCVLFLFPFWGTVFVLSWINLVVPMVKVWFHVLVWLGTLPFWWVRG